jgi:hypothetical protein
MQQQKGGVALTKFSRAATDIPGKNSLLKKSESANRAEDKAAVS